MLYSYVLREDDGAAPNPFGGTCSLVICKPKIRSFAKVGDWILGTGSATHINGSYRKQDLRNRLIYAMEVTRVLTMEKYDDHCDKNLSIKIPKRESQNYEELAGDCIYDFQNLTKKGKPRIRKSFHRYYHRKKDLSGKNALLSSNFFYLGKDAIDNPQAIIPPHLEEIVHKGESHSIHKNNQEFIDWVTSTFQKNKIYGQPNDLS